jgi:hypothetical protein
LLVVSLFGGLQRTYLYGDCQTRSRRDRRRLLAHLLLARGVSAAGADF